MPISHGEPRSRCGFVCLRRGSSPFRACLPYAKRLDADGVDVAHVEYAGTMHAFLDFCGVLSAGRHAIELIATDLAQAFTS